MDGAGLGGADGAGKMERAGLGGEVPFGADGSDLRWSNYVCSSVVEGRPDSHGHPSGQIEFR